MVFSSFMKAMKSIIYIKSTVLTMKNRGRRPSIFINISQNVIIDSYRFTDWFSQIPFYGLTRQVLVSKINRP